MPALIATISGNAVPLQRTLKDVENAARRAGMVVQKSLSHGGVNSGAMREFLVLLREIGRGNWSRVPGSLSILASRLGALKLLFNPVTIGLVAFGTAAFFVARHVLHLAEAKRNLGALMDWTRIKFSEEAQIMKEAAARAQDLRDFINSLGRSQESLADKTMDALRAMREQAKFEREIAAHKGASKKKLEEMDLAEAEKELQFLTRSRLEAQRKVELDKLSLALAGKMANSTDRAKALKGAGEHAQEMGKVVDAIQQKVRTGRVITGIDPAASRAAAVAGGFAPVFNSRKANGSDVFDVTVEGKSYRLSLDQARKILDSTSKREVQLERAQKQLQDVLERKKHTSEGDAASLKQLTKEENELKAHIANLKKFGPGLAQLGGHSSTMHLTSLQGAGGFGATSVGILDVNHKMLRELKNISAKIGQPKMGGVKH